MLLWTALDKGATTHYPLLKKFDPGFQMTLFDSPLLPKRHQMVQLRDVESYLASRKENSLTANPSIFEDVSSALSFGAQYFDRSSAHQQLKERIEREAKDDRKAKKAELNEAKRKFSSLMAESDMLTCTFVTKPGRGRNREEKTTHDPRCSKCALRNQAQHLRISCYEWYLTRNIPHGQLLTSQLPRPLPTEESEAKSVVFELDIPSLIRHWRSTTYRIHADVLSPTPPPQGKRKNVALALAEYRGLENFLKSTADRLQLASSTKPFAQTQHASQSVFEATEDSVCLPNNLKFAMLDSKSQQRTSEYLDKYNIHERCTLKLPRGCYETLQYAVSDTKHTSNEIISRQGTCPDGLTVHEFHAFAALRSGHRLQVRAPNSLFHTSSSSTAVFYIF
jgi:hypothetical protein